MPQENKPGESKPTGSSSENDEKKRRVIFSLDANLHDELREIAESDDLSLNQLVTRVLARYANQGPQESKSASCGGRIAELRDLKELRSCLDPKTDKEHIAKLDTAIHSLALSLSNADESASGESKPEESKPNESQSEKPAGQKAKWWENSDWPRKRDR